MPVLLLAEDRARQVVVAQVIRRDGPDGAQEVDRQAHLVRQRLGVLVEDVAQAVLAVDPHRSLPGEVIEPDVLEVDPLRGDAEAMRPAGVAG